MKITALKTYLVEPRWLFLKVETDAGISGWGEPVLEGHAETLAAKIGELEDFLIGRNPLMIEDIWQSIYRNGCYRGGPVLMSAIAGIDMALWDIKGRYHDAPVHALMGGKVRDFIRSYCWIGGDRPQNLEVEAAALMARGFDCTKLNATRELRMIDCYREVDRIVAQMGALRDFVGDRMDIALDFHGRVHVPMAKVLLKELEPLRPIFVEDVVASSQIDAMADLAKFTSIPLAVGERLHSRYDFKRVFETRAASLINPDTAHAGGISEMVRIGHMAEAYDVAIAPHCPLGPIALAASLQVDAVCQNAVLQEQSLGMHYNGPVDMQDYLVEGTGFDLREGCLYIPEGPGLGIEINEEFVVKQALKGHKWRAPEWRHADGSVAEW
ncbi:MULTISPECIES: galactonate dehydratase [Falsihalocynthiibacter]|uniref:galactonate dehydratase n=1 Tax=Falsihalocynthiibacter TaxID=2854182 RepID=UPI0030017D7C